MDFDMDVRSETSVMAVITSCNGVSRVPARLVEAHAQGSDTPDWKKHTRGAPTLAHALRVALTLGQHLSGAPPELVGAAAA
jgi:hypothetical protein